MAGRRGTAVALVLLALAGCLSAPRPLTDPKPPRLVLGADTGAISGTVLDDASFPLPAVDVVIAETHARARTDLRGHFQFPNLDPGTYRLVYRFLGYQSQPQAVDVAAGTATNARYVIRTSQIDPGDLRTVITERGFIQCSANPYYPVNPCGSAAGDDKDQFLFSAQPGKAPVEVVLELVWTPSAAETSKDLELDLCDAQADRTDDVVCLHHDYYRFQTGASPNVMRLTDMPFATHDTWLAGVGAGYQSSVVLQQSFVLYVTLCYYHPCGPEYTAVPAT